MYVGLVVPCQVISRRVDGRPICLPGSRTFGQGLAWGRHSWVHSSSVWSRLQGPEAFVVGWLQHAGIVPSNPPHGGRPSKGNVFSLNMNTDRASWRPGGRGLKGV